MIPNEAVIAVVDGEHLKMFRNTGNENDVKLVAIDEPEIEPALSGSASVGRQSAGNPDGGTSKEAGFAVGVADMLNNRVLNGKVSSLVIIAAPKTLGELRQQYHKNLEAVLVGEIPKTLTGHKLADIEEALAAALA